NVWFFTGLGVTWNNYRFDDDIKLSNGNFTNAYHDTTAGVSHQKSKLVASYLTAPIMFEFFTSRKYKNAFHMGVGGTVGLLIGSHTKNKVEIDGETKKLKDFGDFNLNPFRYGFRVAMGYGRLNVFADYYASTLFKDKKGPVLYPVNVGITLVGL
ncbi:MAG: outer membrane beta-barrel protein, partial [Bacteroidia bacterium]|nr:outer membrane beta-barrel protein [Bacteroidia bacterium]